MNNQKIKNKIKEMFKTKDKLWISEIADKLGIKPSEAKRYTNELREEGFLKDEDYEIREEERIKTAKAILQDVKEYRVKAEAALLLSKEGAKRIKLIGEIAGSIKDGLIYKLEQKYLQKK